MIAARSEALLQGELLAAVEVVQRRRSPLRDSDRRFRLRIARRNSCSSFPISNMARFEVRRPRRPAPTSVLRRCRLHANLFAHNGLKDWARRRGRQPPNFEAMREWKLRGDISQEDCVFCRSAGGAVRALGPSFPGAPPLSHPREKRMIQYSRAVGEGSEGLAVVLDTRMRGV